MTGARPVFPEAEFRRRVAELQAGMDRAGLAALLLTTAPDIYYVAGFLTRFWESPTRPWFVVVPAQGDPVAVIPAIGRTLMGRTWLADIRTWDAPDPADDGVTLLSDTLCELVPDGAVVGLPMGPETHLRLPLGDFRRIDARIGSRSFTDATDVIRRVREVKSEPEVEKIRAACQIGDAAFARVPEIAKAGRPLDTIFREFQIALLQEGADWVAYLAGGAGPGGYGDVISPASQAPLQAGDVLMLDTGAVRDGYHCDFDRNFAIGAATDDARRAHVALTLAAEAALGQLRPGMRACDGHRIMSESLAARGATPAAGRFGHGLGLALTEWPSLVGWDKTELRAGMVLTLEPCVELAPGRIMVHEENIVLRDDGAERLTAAPPRDLPEIGP